jgi:hypothetical protein
VADLLAAGRTILRHLLADSDHLRKELTPAGRTRR